MANTLLKLYRLGIDSESRAVRLCATYLLVKGKVELTTDSEWDEIAALMGIGCDVEWHGSYVVVTCPGARECYTNEDFAEGVA